MKAKIKTKIDFINWLKDKGVTKLPPGTSIKSAVETIEGVEDAKNEYKELMSYQIK